MKPTEFYITPEGQITLRPLGEPERQLKESDREFIEQCLSVLQEYYPEAYEALMEVYSVNINNKWYRDFLAVRRFLKCNLGLYDNQIDVDENWNFKFEFVSCPMHGECKYDGVICKAKFCSKLSDRQLEVMRMCYEGKKDDEIAETLYISINTVSNHRKASFKKIGVHNMAEFVRYAYTNNLFKD